MCRLRIAWSLAHDLGTRYLAASVVGLGLVVWVACSGGGGSSSCTAGQSSSCTCTNGALGSQVCQSDGTYGSCMCSGGSGSSGGSDGGAIDAGLPCNYPTPTALSSNEDVQWMAADDQGAYWLNAPLSTSDPFTLVAWNKVDASVFQWATGGLAKITGSDAIGPDGFYEAYGNLVHLARQSSTPIVVAPAPSGDTLQFVRTDETNVYFSASIGQTIPYQPGYQILSVPVGGGQPPATLYSTNVGSPTWGLAIDAQNVYYFTMSGNSADGIWSLAKIGGTPTKVVANPSTGASPRLEVASGNLYWDGAGGINTSLTSGGPPRILYQGTSPRLMAVDEQFVYAIDTMSNTQIVMQLDPSGQSPPLVMYTNQYNNCGTGGLDDYIVSVAVDTNTVYMGFSSSCTLQPVVALCKGATGAGSTSGSSSSSSSSSSGGSGCVAGTSGPGCCPSQGLAQADGFNCTYGCNCDSSIQGGLDACIAGICGARLGGGCGQTGSAPNSIPCAQGTCTLNSQSDAYYCQ